MKANRRWVVMVSAVGVATAAGLAMASTACTNDIPFCFVANEPALATEVNANFDALKKFLETKVGPTGTLAARTPNITTTGTITTSAALSAQSVATGRIVATNYAPAYTDWNSIVQGAGGASIVNDSSGYQALMVVGNNSGNGATRVVKVFDNLVVGGPSSRTGTRSRACRGSRAACSGSAAG